MKDFFPESLDQKRGCALYMVKYGTKVNLERDLPEENLRVITLIDEKLAF